MPCRYDYILNDYQGNVRAVISQSGVLEEVNAYYPYGGLLGAPATSVQARKYGGKELDRENGLIKYMNPKSKPCCFIKQQIYIKNIY